MTDIALLAALVVTFALAITAHVLIVAGMISRGRSARALAALVVPPLAPAWAIGSGMTGRGVLWIVAVVGYGVAWALSRT